MPINTEYVLPHDVLILTRDALSPELHRSIALGENERILTRKASRSRSRVLDSEGAELLTYFRSARTIPAAVEAFSTSRRLDPLCTLEEAYPLIKDLVAAGWLVERDAVESQAIRYTLSVGDEVAGFSVLQCIQLLEDTEVYKVASVAHGSLGALKLIRGVGKTAREGLAREAVVLRRLEGGPVPRLISSGSIEGDPYIIMSWIDGMAAHAMASHLRRLPRGSREREFKGLIVATLKSYRDLHARGVFHSDVHPSNLLIDAEGGAWVVDFSFSALYLEGKIEEDPPRNLIAYFKDPLHAQASLANTKRPPPDEKSDQFALGALFTFLIAGRHYMNFSLEREQQLRQILTGSPLTFAELGVEEWPEMESCLRRMLAKDPSDRYGGLAECLDEISGVAVPEERIEHRLPRFDPGQMKAFDRYGTAVDKASLLNAPSASVNYGAAGVAYALYRRAVLRRSSEDLAASDGWALQAERELRRPEGLANHEIGISREALGDLSIYHSAAGVYLTQARIAWSMGDVVTENEAVSRFVTECGRPGKTLDYTLGKAGMLSGCAMLRNIRPDDDRVRRAGESLASELSAKLARLPRIQEQSEIPFMGFAHGWAGILHALLSWIRHDGAPARDVCRARLSELSSLTVTSRFGASWPRKVGSRRSSAVDADDPSWCNGSAGFVWLWTLAYELFRDEEYLELAVKAGLHAWLHPDAISNLCCGKAGRAFALMRLHAVADDQVWLSRAHQLILDALQDRVHGEFPEASLIKGRLGVELAALELSYPRLACFPLVC